jgi:hypothetical protein
LRLNPKRLPLNLTSSPTRKDDEILLPSFFFVDVNAIELDCCSPGAMVNPPIIATLSR